MKLVTIITGAGSGIGRASAIELARQGHRLVLAGRRIEALEETAQLLEGDCITQVCDVTQEDQVAALFAQAAAHFGRVDVLFNNAGAFGGGPIDQIPLSKWREMIDVNLTGYFLCAREAFRHMKAQAPQGGRIINNGSVSAHVPRPNSAPYSAAKHGVTGLTRSLALDGRAHNIACGQIDIGNAATPLSSGFDVGMPQADGSIKPEPTFDVAAAARAVGYMASLPLDTNVLFLSVMASGMPFVGRG